MDFVVVDVETANADLSSICQIGIASFQSDSLADAWVSLVNPGAPFSSTNISIHGIYPRDVESAPTWPEIYPHVADRLQGMVVVSHTPFDRVALERACLRANMQDCDCMWLDSAAVVRRAWPEFSQSGYGLANVARCFGIDYQAHDALEDARCAGLILLRAIEHTGIRAEEWLRYAGHHRSSQSGSLGHSHTGWKSYPGPVKREGNPDGKLAGEVVVFTGELTVSRSEAAKVASMAGCQVDDGVTKRTTLLVVGDQDIERLAGHDKSSKERKAELLINKGHMIQILTESDFQHLLAWAAKADNN